MYICTHLNTTVQFLKVAGDTLKITALCNSIFFSDFLLWQVQLFYSRDSNKQISNTNQQCIAIFSKLINSKTLWFNDILCVFF